MSEPRERLARNQTLFREVNERIETTGGDNEVVEFLCECSDANDLPQIERVISQDDGYMVVEKLILEEYMEETDRRFKT
jgi:hypothetical protein